MAKNRTQHTAEPWNDHGLVASTGFTIRKPSGWIICEAMYPADQKYVELAKANAARIVACVNACEGIADPDVVKEMVTILRNLATTQPHQGIIYILERIDGGK